MISVAKLEKDRAQPSFYRTVRVCDTPGKPSEKSTPIRVYRDINKSGLLHEEQFVFQPTHSTKLLPVGGVQELSTTFGKTRPAEVASSMRQKP
jgi:hypothetical protein